MASFFYNIWRFFYEIHQTECHEFLTEIKLINQSRTEINSELTTTRQVGKFDFFNQCSLKKKLAVDEEILIKRKVRIINLAFAGTKRISIRFVPAKWNNCHHREDPRNYLEFRPIFFATPTSYFISLYCTPKISSLSNHVRRQRDTAVRPLTLVYRSIDI